MRQTDVVGIHQCNNGSISSFKQRITGFDNSAVPLSFNEINAIVLSHITFYYRDAVISGRIIGNEQAKISMRLHQQ